VELYLRFPSSSRVALLSTETTLYLPFYIISVKTTFENTGF